MNKLILVLLSVVLFQSCKNLKISEINIKANRFISQLSDSSFMSDIRSIQFDKYIYMTDYDRDQLLILDSFGNTINSLGSKGKGPGEFLGASHLFVNNDTIFVYNDGKKSFEVFDLNNHLKTLRLPEKIELSSSFRFFLQKNRLYCSAISDSTSILSFDIKTYDSKKIGKLTEFESLKQTRIRNNKHLFCGDEFFIAVSDNLPIIEKYDYNGNLLGKYDYSYVPLIKNRIETIHNLEKDPNGYDCLLQDAFYYENKLYLLAYSNVESKISCNNVIVVENIDGEMLVRNTYHLGSHWYKSICISNGILYAYGNGGLAIFDIN